MLLISRRFLAFQWVDDCYKTEIVSEKKKMKEKRSREYKRIWVVMFGRGLCDNKTVYKHTGHCHGRRTRPRVARYLQLHRQCVAKPPRHRLLHPGETHRPSSARYLWIRHGNRAHRKACSAPAPRISQKRVP